MHYLVLSFFKILILHVGLFSVLVLRLRLKEVHSVDYVGSRGISWDLVLNMTYTPPDMKEANRVGKLSSQCMANAFKPDSYYPIISG